MRYTFTPSSVLRADGVGVSFGDRRVFADLSLTVSPGQRVGLLGENGAGKSTLLGVLAGELEPDAGRVERPDATALLRQEVRTDPDAPLAAILEAELGGLRALERDLAAAGEALAGDDPGAADRYAALLEAADAAELWTLDARRDELLDGLGVGHLPLDRPVGEVSGGQRSRVALAALLLARPDALLLDEPTNHLDLATREALSMALNEFEGTVMLVSHDRALLRAVCDEFWMVGRGAVGPFDGDLDDYQRYLLDEAKRQRELAREESSRATETIAAAPAPASARPQKTSEKPPAPAADARELRRQSAQARAQQAEQLRPLRQEIERTDRRLAELGQECAALHERLAGPLAPADIAECGRRLKGAQEETQRLEERWLDLSGQLEAAAQTA